MRRRNVCLGWRAGGANCHPVRAIAALVKNEETQEAVGDWLYWVDHGVM